MIITATLFTDRIITYNFEWQFVIHQAQRDFTHRFGQWRLIHMNLYLKKMKNTAQFLQYCA